MKIYSFITLVSSLSVKRGWIKDDALDYIPEGVTLYQKRFPDMLTHSLVDLIDHGIVKY